jgi:hypothetical protein
MLAVFGHVNPAAFHAWDACRPANPACAQILAEQRIHFNGNLLSFYENAKNTPVEPALSPGGESPGGRGRVIHSIALANPAVSVYRFRQFL